MVRKLPKRAILEHLRKICVFDHMGARIFTTPWHKYWGEILDSLITFFCPYHSLELGDGEALKVLCSVRRVSNTTLLP